MKRRNGFVSNSSSSSFVIAVPAGTDAWCDVTRGGETVSVNLNEYEYTLIKDYNSLYEWIHEEWVGYSDWMVNSDTPPGGSIPNIVCNYLAIPERQNEFWNSEEYILLKIRQFTHWLEEGFDISIGSVGDQGDDEIECQLYLDLDQSIITGDSILIEMGD